MLQEIVQAKGLLTPDYEVISEEGPDHNKVFTVQVLVDKKVMGEGTGKTKQLAQQEAAFQALEDFDKS